MEEVDGGNPIKTASRELREETGYNSVLKGGERLSTITNVGMPKHRFVYAKDKDLSSKDEYVPLSTTITRPTFGCRPDGEPGTVKLGWFGPERKFTYYLGLCKDLDKIDFSAKRDPAITDMKFVPFEELHLMCRPSNKKFNNYLHPEDYNAIVTLVQRSIDQYKAKIAQAQRN